MSDFLFKDFPPISPKAWKQKIQVDLEGANYNKNLLWVTEENITVKPFYTKEDRTHQQINLPKEYNICSSIFIDNENVANKLALVAIKNGMDSIEFIANKEFNIQQTLRDINFKTTNVYFNLQFLNIEFVNKISSFIDSKNLFFNIDIIGNLAKTGNWFYNLNKDHSVFSEIIKSNNNSICVNASLYQNAGATITQQLAYTLAHGNEYLNYYGKSITDKIHFNFSLGSNYFFEIAKLRAFRILWKALLKEYNTDNNNTHIFSKPSLRNKTLYSNNINILRTTSECMSAVLGGSDTITNIAFDEIFHKSNEFSEKASQDQLLNLKQEINIKHDKDIVAGTYYIESITRQLAKNALEIFKLIEKSGGFLKQLKEGIIQKKITESASKEQHAFNSGKLILIGTNKLQNKTEVMNNQLELYPFIKKRHIKTLIQPIIQRRLAEDIEQERLKNE